MDELSDGKIQYAVEVWNGDKPEVLACASDRRLAWAAYKAAIDIYPNRQLTIRQRMHVITRMIGRAEQTRFT